MSNTDALAVDLERIEDSPHLLDILLQMEDTLDSLDLYVFRNWIRGEVVDGPKVQRYWLEMTLKYPWKDMPDPRGALRLLRHGIRVWYQKAREERRGVTSDDEKLGEEEGEEKGAPIKTDKIWLVKISMPRRLVSQIANAEMDYYDDEIDAEDVEDAKDTGIDSESAYEQQDEDKPSSDDDNEENGTNAAQGGSNAR